MPRSTARGERRTDAPDSAAPMADAASGVAGAAGSAEEAGAVVSGSRLPLSAPPSRFGALSPPEPAASMAEVAEAGTPPAAVFSAVVFSATPRSGTVRFEAPRFFETGGAEVSGAEATGTLAGTARTGRAGSLDVMSFLSGSTRSVRRTGSPGRL
ncbi:hypothetical protein ACH4C2_37465 [Streptomyces sp. NPDC018057]|uniref:hypothetical protein n=1 Tax=unclassified Streptomyces TaxID=2593676 RepID=UPI0037AECA10